MILQHIKKILFEFIATSLELSFDAIVPDAAAKHYT